MNNPVLDQIEETTVKEPIDIMGESPIKVEGRLDSGEKSHWRDYRRGKFRYEKKEGG